MAFTDIRVLVFQNASTGKLYSVRLNRAADGSVSFSGWLVGAAAGGFGSGSEVQANSEPEFDNTKVVGVVLTASLAAVFGPLAKTDSYLSQAAIFHASNPAGTGAALSTICV